MNESALRVRAYREQAGLTQVELAERLGISQGFLGHVERGDKAISVAMAIRIEQALGPECPAEQLNSRLAEFVDLYKARLNPARARRRRA